MTPQSDPESTQPLGEGARLAGVFFSPGKAFADIAARPRFWVPLIISTIMALIVVTAMSQRVGFERAARQGVESSSRAQSMSAEQKEQAVQLGAKIGQIGAFVAGGIGPAIAALICGAVLLLVFNGLFSAGLRFAQSFAIYCYASLVGIVSAILMIVVMYTKNPDDIDLKNPLAFNLGAYLPEGTSKALISLGSSIDLFSFWLIAVLAIGYAAASPRKLTFSKALIGVLIPWAVWVLGKAALTAIFS